MSFGDFDALANKQAANRVFDSVDTPDQLLAVLDQRSVFSHLVFGHVNPRELSHHRQSSQLERVVFVRLAFDVLPLPGRIVGAADKRLETQLLAQVADPTAGPTGFHHDQVNLVILEDRREIVPCRRHRLKSIFLRFGIEKAAHRVEFSEVDCENVHHVVSVVWGVNVTRCYVSLDRSQHKN